MTSNINKKYLILTSCLLIFTVFFSVIAFSLFFDIVKKSENFVLKKKDWEYLIAKSKEMEKVRGYDEVEKKLEEVQGLFSNPQKPIEDVLFLKEIADKNNLSIEINFEKSEKSKGDIWPHLQFKIYVLGFFPDFIKFFEEIESKKRMVSIESLFIKKETGKSRLKDGHEFLENKIEAEINLKAYFLEE